MAECGMHGWADEENCARILVRSARRADESARGDDGMEDVTSEGCCNGLCGGSVGRGGGGGATCGAWL